MRKQISALTIFFICLFIKQAALAQQTIAQPYYGEAKIRFYNKSNPVASSPCYTLDLSADANTNWGVTQGINDVVIYQGKLFVSFDAGNGTGGVLVYNYADVYPAKTAGPVAVIKPQTTAGLATAGIAIQPSTGNLFLGTFFDGTNDAGLYEYTASSGYATGSQFASYFNDASVDSYIADIAFDASGNLWFTEFDGNNTAAGNYLICYKAANKSNYYKIVNPGTANYASVSLSGGAGPTVYLLSQPEGIAFDASGNLWLGNNNDDYNCNPSGDGTLVKISAGWITGTLFNQAYASSNTVPANSATVNFIAGSKPGGLFFDGSNLYINDQGQNQGSSYTTNGTVWKWDVTTAFNATNFAASGIHTTYPGNGLMALDNSQFSVASDCVASSTSSEKNILTFSIPSQVGSTIIDTSAATVSVVIPYTSNLASLTPAISVSAYATINPQSGIAENFSSPVTYTVTAQDASTKHWTVTVTQQQQQVSGGTAGARAAALGKGMNLSVWLENEYWFNSTTTYPDVTRFTETDIANLKSLCFNSVRLPVLFEGYASPQAPYAFNLGNANVVAGLNYVDSVIKWCADNHMMLVIDNHIADDNGSADQTNYQITDANYTTQAELIAAVWKQVIARYGYTNPDQVVFELRNEPNSVSDANLRLVYQTVIDTVRQYDQTHTLVVGNTGYYDPIALSQSAPYSDTNIIYTTHIYDGDGFYGFCEQGTGGVTNTDSNTVTPIAFPKSGEVAEINTEMNDVKTWASTNHVPVWLSEFGCTTLPDVYHDDTSRCNYINAIAAAINNTGMPWAYWDGYGPDDYVSGFGNPTPLYYGFSIFDRNNILTAQHLDACFASALQVGGTCSVLPNGLENITDNGWAVNIYPNPANNNISVEVTGSTDAVEIGIFDISGRNLYTHQQAGNAEITRQIDVSSFAAGVYVLRVKENGLLAQKKFIVIH